MAAPSVSVSLRPLTVADWPRVHEWASTAAACRFQVWGPNSPEETRAFVEAAAREWTVNPLTRRVWAAEAEGDGVIGIGELHVRDQEEGQGGIAYAVHVDLWGRGYGEAIARAVVQIAFDEVGLHRVVATCDPRNVASARVLQKIGMTFDRRLHRTLLLRDGWPDSDVYTLIGRA
jgi:ribosomal-protein-alanine N-acetyltransferase